MTMQNLWSRIGHATCSCKCPSCVFTKAAVARRAATTGRGQFVRPVLQSATFSYSAIFAGAVAIDGGLKENRRRKLEHELAEARGGLHDQAQSVADDDAKDAMAKPGRTAWGLGNVTPSEDEQCRKVEIISGESKSDFEILDGISWLDAQLYDVEANSKPAWPRNFGPRVDPRRLPPQSLWASNEAAEEASARPWTHRKLRTLELAVGYFVLQTLIKNGLYANGPGTVHEVPASLERWMAMTHFQLVNTARTLQMAMWEVRNAKLENWEAVHRRQVGFIPQLERGMPRYEQDAEGNFRTTQKQLNASLWSAMNEALCRTDLDVHRDLAMRICHDLLSSEAPPTHKTINLLLAGFTKLNDPISAEETRKLMSFAHIRANERTCVAVLNHYTISGDAKGFTDFVQKMRGRVGGLMLARPDLAVGGSNSQTLLIKPDAESRKVVQKVQPTPLVLNAIVAGLLKFVGFDTALRLVSNLRRDGWGLDKDGLELFLRDCLKARDFENGSRIWKQIKELGPLGRADADRCAVMLRLCLDCAKEEEFRTIFEEVKHSVAHPETLKHMITNRTIPSKANSDKWVRNRQHTIPRQMRKAFNKPSVSNDAADVQWLDRSSADLPYDAGPINSNVFDKTNTVMEQTPTDEVPRFILAAQTSSQPAGMDAGEEPGEANIAEGEEVEDLDTLSWSPTMEDELPTSNRIGHRGEGLYRPGPWSIPVARSLASKSASKSHVVDTVSV